MENKSAHWEHVYETKGPADVSWTQEVPQTSLNYINECQLPKDANIIDIGGGDSKLVDFLLEAGYQNITVLDISKAALNKAQQRLGEKASLVTWIVQDITTFSPKTTYDCWHDRAAFHFMTTPEQIQQYISVASNYIRKGGYAIIGTFSNDGPEKCSGLPVARYSETALTATLQVQFEKIKCITEDHITPFNTTQHFLFCAFRKK
ncbi:class I SAM-dependent methyltransferase [Chitinophaga sp.]|uniref:class I SAM-dependent methyltransferase n=1 Tax=Chitinophaga sp. TaxID=1869181 RepID=UPI0031D37B6B